jgi:hypothetical protein
LKSIIILLATALLAFTGCTTDKADQLIKRFNLLVEDLENINLLPLTIERETYSTLKRRPNPVKIQQDFYILGTFPHEE